MGGFVEPDEEKLNQAKNITKLRIFAAGSSTNIILGIFFIVLLSNFPATVAPFYNVVSAGVQIGSVPDNLPAYSSGLKAGDTVISINGTRVSGITDLRNAMSKVSPGEVLVVGTKTGSYTVRTGVDQNNASHAVIGISGLTDLIIYDPKLPFLSSDFPNILLHSEYWLSVVLVSVALINMLPMYPFDGDKFIETALNLLGLRRTNVIRSALNVTAYALLFLNVGLSLLQIWISEVLTACPVRRAHIAQLPQSIRTIMKACLFVPNASNKPLEEKARRTIVRHGMLEFNDHVAVAVSGGKDSLTLLNVLVKLETRFPRSKITAISVDEGIKGYRDEALEIAREACEKLGVEQAVVSYRELFGTTIDELTEMHLGQTPCSYCGVLRRKAINRAAAMVGATKIATGHNLDDEVQTVLLNMLHGDPWRVQRSSPVLRDPRGKFLCRIKPLCEIPEKEIVLYALLEWI